MDRDKRVVERITEFVSRPLGDSVLPGNAWGSVLECVNVQVFHSLYVFVMLTRHILIGGSRFEEFFTYDVICPEFLGQLGWDKWVTVLVLSRALLGKHMYTDFARICSACRVRPLLRSLVTCIANDGGCGSGNQARNLWKVLEYLLKVGETVGNIWRINCQRQTCRTLWRFQLCRQPTLPINKYVGKHNTGLRVGVTESDVSLPSPRKRTRTEKTSDAATQLLEFFKRSPVFSRMRSKKNYGRTTHRNDFRAKTRGGALFWDLLEISKFCVKMCAFVWGKLWIQEAP